MQKKIISGIQQIGIGVGNVYEAWKWYIENFGMDVRIFEERAKAEYMLPYTGGKPKERHAALALNMMGGGGFEIWQHTERIPEAPEFEIRLGDLGIFACKLKTPNALAAYSRFKQNNIALSVVEYDPADREHFFVKDPFGNIFQVVEEEKFYTYNPKKSTGGAYGAIIGTSDPDRAMKLYSDILGYDRVVYDKEGVFDDLKDIPGGHHQFRRVLLQHSEERMGAFSKFFGPTEIELFRVLDREPEKIFRDRYWGDFGFIHLCFDVIGIKLLKKECEEKGFPFTVDSDVHPEGKPFDMGEAAGHFAYIEDPDGTLIEFVETHKMPLVKKYGWYLNLHKRKHPGKPLPDWLLKMLRFMRVTPQKLK